MLKESALAAAGELAEGAVVAGAVQVGKADLAPSQVVEQDHGDLTWGHKRHYQEPLAVNTENN